VAPGTAFDHTAADGAPEASHEQGFEKSVEKSVREPMPPYRTLKTTGAHGGLLPGKFFPKKAYLLEIHVNK
jgi:hypothetical protein